MNKVIKNILPRLLFLPILIVATGSTVLAQASSAIDAVIQKAIESKTFPAAAVVVIHDGKVQVAKGYGTANIGDGMPTDQRTVFQIASVTKQFTAAGVLLLVEEGKLNLDDTLGKYLPDVPTTWSGVTVRQLLNQVSGIPNYTALGKLVNDKSYSHAELLGLVQDLPLRFQPGTKWEYSNTNYYLLGMVIEKVSGKTYPKFMNERIFSPLGMNDTQVNTSGLKLKNAASGYELKMGKWEAAKLDDPSQPFAAGAIVSTAADMAKWALAVSEGKLLQKSSWDQAFAVGKLANGTVSNYGFGWQTGRIGEIGYLGHSGGIAGFGSHIISFPADNLVVAVLTNTATRAPQQIAIEIAGLYLPKVGAVVAAQNAARNAAPITDEDLETTKFVRRVFEGMLKGEGDPSLFSLEMQKLMFPDNIKQLKGPLGSQGALIAFDLLASENTGGNKRRTYRAIFESGMKVRANFTVDSHGKIAEANVRPE